MIGYVYKIVSNETDKCYVGSTTQKINKRFSKHKYSYKKYIDGNFHYISSFEILQYDDAKIVLIDEIEFEDKTDLHKLEGKYIIDLDCVNKCIGGRTTKEYYQENKDKLKQYKKQYYEKNTDKIKQYNKEYQKKYRNIKKN